MVMMFVSMGRGNNVVERVVAVVCVSMVERGEFVKNVVVKLFANTLESSISARHEMVLLFANMGNRSLYVPIVTDHKFAKLMDHHIFQVVEPFATEDWTSSALTALLTYSRMTLGPGRCVKCPRNSKWEPI